MKFTLIIWVCTFLQSNTCMKPIKYPQSFDSWYECSRTAHVESIKILRRGGFAWVNKYEIGTKYSCIPEETV